MKTVIHPALVTGCIVILGLPDGATARQAPPPQPEAQRRNPVQRPPQNPKGDRKRNRRGPAQYPQEFRTIDGGGNNGRHPDWGASGADLLRLTPAAYADGVGDVPAGVQRSSARVVSNLVSAQVQDMPNPRGVSDFIWQWGQFLDHDIDETPVADPAEPMDIAVPAGDAWFDPTGSGEATIPLNRSAWTTRLGVRQQLNNITAYIDASNVYGSDTDRADALRTLDGTGRLRTSENDLLPFNDLGLDNAPTSFDPTLFLAGDIRANEQVGLTAMHTLFVREHNHWADQIAGEHPELDGDEIYARARAIVGAEMQVITYREFLPVLLGPNPLPPYEGYRRSVNAGISNVFATAAYRVGHTMLSPTLQRLDETGAEIEAGHLALADAFFRPDEITQHGIDALLRGLASQRAQDVDVAVIDDVRNFLFGQPGSTGFDLASLNIQRGRDHGLASYNQVRTAFGRPPAQSFAQVTPDPNVQTRLANAYDNPNQIDPWIGLLAEPHRPGALVGETLHRILRDQFARLRDGDRFWYESYLRPEMIDLVEQQTLAQIIRRNTGIGVELSDDVFSTAPGCVADFNGDGQLDQLDVMAFMDAVAAGAPTADIDGNGFVNNQDVDQFFLLFEQGC